MASAGPAGLAALGYRYNDEGRLVTLSGGPFKFTTQAAYDALGDAVLDEIQRRMLDDHGMVRLWVGPGGDEGKGRVVAHDARPAHGRVSEIFATRDVFTNDRRLMMLIQGSGAVRPGQWARSLCINDSLAAGSMLPMIAAFRAAGCSVVVLNPNVRTVETADGREVAIPGSSGRSSHSVSVWETVVARSPAAEVGVVAHSAGGAQLCGLARHLDDKASDASSSELARIKAVAFTDAVHMLDKRDSRSLLTWAAATIVDWVASGKPRDTVISGRGRDGIRELSAGHRKHEWTTAAAMPSILAFFEARMSPLPGPSADGVSGGAGSGGSTAEAATGHVTGPTTPERSDGGAGVGAGGAGSAAAGATSDTAEVVDTCAPTERASAATAE